MATLEEILALEARKKVELLSAREGDLFDPAQFNPAQLGLLPVMVDTFGRLWAVGPKSWKLISSPHKQEEINGKAK